MLYMSRGNNTNELFSKLEIDEVDVSTISDYVLQMFSQAKTLLGFLF